jgi:phosphatidylglycerol:prolipoprotein diacylglycerol transferase
VHNVLLRIDGITVYTYALIMAVALLLGVGIAVWASKRVELNPDNVLDAVILAVIAGIVGARLEYVLLNFDYFRTQPVAAVQIWQGGLALNGGLWAPLPFLFLYARAKRLSFWTLVDTVALGLSGATVVGWLACLYGGCAYGRTGSGLLYFNWYDTFGVSASRFAVQPVGAALSLALAIGLFFLWHRRFLPGSVLLAYLAVLGLIQLGLGFERADETSRWLGWRADQWLNLIQVLVAGSVAAYLALTKPEPSQIGPPSGEVGETPLES